MKKKLKVIEIGKFIYFLSDDEIKEGDWIYRPLHKIVSKMPKGALWKSNEIKKIVATTDKSLQNCQEIMCKGDCCPLLQIPESFVKAFVDSNGIIDEVECEYELITTYYPSEEDDITTYHIKTNSNNEIIWSFVYEIRKVIEPTCSEEKMYSREEVEELINNFYNIMCENTGLEDLRDKWIKENL